MDHYPTYLIHYGIPGQKKGVRRFQNEDGTWTSEGLERRRQLIENGASRKEIRKATREGKDQVRYNKQLYKKQEKIGKKFDKQSEKTLSKMARSGSNVSKRNVDKLTKLGAEYRLADYIAENPSAYYNIKKADERARNSQVLALGTTVLGAATLGIGFGKFYKSINVDKEVKAAYRDAYNRAVEETMKDLKKHKII